MDEARRIARNIAKLPTGARIAAGVPCPRPDVTCYLPRSCTFCLVWMVACRFSANPVGGKFHTLFSSHACAAWQHIRSLCWPQCPRPSQQSSPKCRRHMSRFPRPHIPACRFAIFPRRHPGGPFLLHCPMRTSSPRLSWKKRQAKATRLCRLQIMAPSSPLSHFNPDLQLPDFSNSKQSVPPTQARLGPCSRERHGTD